MILSKKSYLRYPPIKIHPQQIVVFNAIRYSIDICEISYFRLLKNLSLLTDNGKVDNENFASIFLDVWSIINNSVIFKKIICREFGLNGNEIQFNEINKAIKLRDTNQHIDERLSPVYANNDYPVYGSLSWIKLYPNSDCIYSAIFSGSFTNKKSIDISISNQNNEELDDVIQKIEFTSITRKGTRQKHIFENESILINQIIKDLIWWVSELEKQLVELDKKAKFSEIHNSDLLIQLKGKIIDN